MSSHTASRSQVSAGSVAIRPIHASTPRIGTRGTSGVRNGRSSSEKSLQTVEVPFGRQTLRAIVTAILSLVTVYVVLRLASPELDDRFLAGANQAGLVNLKGHRSVGGFRASIYNAMPDEGVEELAQYMRDFARSAG